MFQLVKVDYVIVKINEKNLNTTAANFNDNGYFNQSSCFESDKCQIDHTKVCVGDSLHCNLTRDDYTELLNKVTIWSSLGGVGPHFEAQVPLKSVLRAGLLFH